MDIETDVAGALSGTGLVIRGAFHPGPDDTVPGGAGTLVLIGNVGSDLWDVFSCKPHDTANPLDSWTRRTMARAATRLGASVVFPFDGPPYHPFQRWAHRAEGLRASPWGPLIHPVFGSWHAYRAALLFAGRLPVSNPSPAPHPCDDCADKPCLQACPAGAIGASGYDVPACTSELDGQDKARCLKVGCAARHACPIGRDYVYAAAQAAFHMERFLAANRGKS